MQAPDAAGTAGAAELATDPADAAAAAEELDVTLPDKDACFCMMRRRVAVVLLL